MTGTSATRHRVVIVGSGFGGLFAAKSLGQAPDTIVVTLISRTNHHLFQPLLYQVATGILSEGEIAPATREVLKKKKNVSVELAEVTGFDLKARHISAVHPGGRKVMLSYDSLIVAAGVGQSYFGCDEFSKWAPGMKTLADARRIGRGDRVRPQGTPHHSSSGHGFSARSRWPGSLGRPRTGALAPLPSRVGGNCA
jgi:NADH dehydrogenase